MRQGTAVTSFWEPAHIKTLLCLSLIQRENNRPRKDKLKVAQLLFEEILIYNTHTFHLSQNAEKVSSREAKCREKGSRER